MYYTVSYQTKNLPLMKDMLDEARKKVIWQLSIDEQNDDEKEEN